MPAIQYKTSVSRPRGDLVAAIPQSLINHNAVVERSPRLTGPELQGAAAKTLSDLEQARAALRLMIPGVDPDAVVAGGIGWPSALTHDQCRAVIEFERAVERDEGAVRRWANYRERHPDEDLAL